MFPFAPAPAAFDRTGSLPDVARDFVEHIRAEGRTSWVAPSSALRLDAHGRLSAEGFPPAALEEGGLRALLVFYNERFPRATPLFSRLTAATAAAVFEELFDYGDPRFVRVAERRNPDAPPKYRLGGVGNGKPMSQVYLVTPSTYPTEYNVGSLVRDTAALLDGAQVPCSLVYDPCNLNIVFWLHFDLFSVCIEGTDRYGDEGIFRFSVWTRDGENLGDPVPTLRKRRAQSGTGAGATIADGIATRLAAAPDFFAAKRPAEARRHTVEEVRELVRCKGDWPHTGTWANARQTGRRGETEYTCGGHGGGVDGCGKTFLIDTSD